ncbi:Purple acid phosphatase 23 [Sarracenia purpurea var. burkii]
MAEFCRLGKTSITFVITTVAAVIAQSVPSTLEGPFRPVTRRFDPSLRRGSDDLPMDHPRLKRNVTSMFPDQIALALSSPSSMWVSWITGLAKRNFGYLKHGLESWSTRIYSFIHAVHLFLLSDECIFSLFHFVSSCWITVWS